MKLLLLSETLNRLMTSECSISPPGICYNVQQCEVQNPSPIALELGCLQADWCQWKEGLSSHKQCIWASVTAVLTCWIWRVYPIQAILVSLAAELWVDDTFGSLHIFLAFTVGNLTYQGMFGKSGQWPLRKESKSTSGLPSNEHGESAGQPWRRPSEWACPETEIV